MTPLFHQHRIAIVAGQNPDPRTSAVNDRRANEHRFQLAKGFAVNSRHAGIQLPSIPVPTHRNVNQAKRRLLRIFHLCGHQNRSSASPENRLPRAKLAQRLEHRFPV